MHFPTWLTSSPIFRKAFLLRKLYLSKYQGRQIDLLSVDAEAHDFEVIESLDFNRYSPRLIAVETHLRLLPDVMRRTTALSAGRRL